MYNASFSPLTTAPSRGNCNYFPSDQKCSSVLYCLPRKQSGPGAVESAVDGLKQKQNQLRLAFPKKQQIPESILLTGYPSFNTASQVS